MAALHLSDIMYVGESDWCLSRAFRAKGALDEGSTLKEALVLPWSGPVVFLRLLKRLRGSSTVVFDPLENVERRPDGGRRFPELVFEQSVLVRRV